MRNINLTIASLTIFAILMLNSIFGFLPFIVYVSLALVQVGIVVYWIVLYVRASRRGTNTYTDGRFFMQQGRYRDGWDVDKHWKKKRDDTK